MSLLGKLTVWRLGVLCWLSAGALAAYDLSGLKPQGYVSDFAGVVDAASRAELERYSEAVEKQIGVQMAFVTLPSLQGEPLEDAAEALFRAWGIGKRGTDEGVLVLLAIADRRVRIETGYGLEPYIPDGFAGSIIREMAPALRQQQYGPALLQAGHAVGARVAGAKGVQLQAQIPAGARRVREERRDLPWPVVIGGIFLLMWLMGAVGGAGRRRRYGYGGRGMLTPMVLGSLLGRGFHGRRGGGGFGGFDSRGGFGGFGGFGGGRSGGGGASGGW